MRNVQARTDEGSTSMMLASCCVQFKGDVGCGMAKSNYRLVMCTAHGRFGQSMPFVG